MPITYVKFLIEDLLGLKPQYISYLFLRKFISKKRASVSDKTSSLFNNLKGILFRIKSTMLPPQKSLSNMNGFSRPGKRNWSKGNVSSIFVSGRSRISILSDTIEVSNSDLFLVELIFHWATMIRFGFSRRKLCKI